MIFIKNSLKRDVGLVQFSSFRFENVRIDDVSFEFEDYLTGNSEVPYYSSGINIYVDCVSVALVGLNLRENLYSDNLQFNVFKIIFNKFFENEVIKHVDENNCIIDIYDIIKKSVEKWQYFIRCANNGFAITDFKKFIYSELDKLDNN